MSYLIIFIAGLSIALFSYLYFGRNEQLSHQEHLRKNVELTNEINSLKEKVSDMEDSKNLKDEPLPSKHKFTF